MPKRTNLKYSRYSWDGRRVVGWNLLRGCVVKAALLNVKERQCFGGYTLHQSGQQGGLRFSRVLLAQG